MANFEAECNEKVHNIQQAHEAKVISFREHVRECTITNNYILALFSLVYRILVSLNH